LALQPAKGAAFEVRLARGEEGGITSQDGGDGDSVVLHCCSIGLGWNITPSGVCMVNTMRCCTGRRNYLIDYV